MDHRSYEIMQLRIRHGPELAPRPYQAMRARLAECRDTLRESVPLEDRNRLLLALLSTAAGEDVTDRFVHEFGFNPRTRERQRGY